MVNHCANPKCLKPLHYLREGRIFVFDVPDTRVAKKSVGGRSVRMEHYWLCGDCSLSLVLEKSEEEGVRVIAKQPLRPRRAAASRAAAIAS